MVTQTQWFHIWLECYLNTFDEIEDGYYSGGTQLYNLCKALDDASAKEELQADGLKLKFEESTTKDGKRSFTRITVMSND